MQKWTYYCLQDIETSSSWMVDFGQHRTWLNTTQIQMVVAQVFRFHDNIQIARTVYCDGAQMLVCTNRASFRSDESVCVPEGAHLAAAADHQVQNKASCHPRRSVATDPLPSPLICFCSSSQVNGNRLLIWLAAFCFSESWILLHLYYTTSHVNLYFAAGVMSVSIVGVLCVQEA